MRKLFTRFSAIALCWAITLGLSTTQAQTWTAPDFNGSDPTSGSQYYMYNLGSKGFLNQGGAWATQAAVSSQPNANASTTLIKWTPANTSGSTWTFQLNNGSNVSGKYLFPASTTDGSVYTDNSTNNTWNLVATDATNHIYSIQINSGYAGYSATQYLGSALATESTNKGIANVVRYNRASGDSYTQWKFVSQADYDLYNAKVLLDRYMHYAKLKGGIDLTSYIYIYNTNVTADISSAAANLLTALNRTDVTSLITNASFESTTALTGWTNGGSFSRQSNSPGQGWTKDGTYYCEKWTNSGSNLVVGNFTQTLSGLSNGVYGMVVSGHAVQQAGSNPLHTGAFFTAGTASTEVAAGQDYNVDYINVSNGTLTIGYALQATVACNWTGFDNFRLYYYGATVVPALTVSKTSMFFSSTASAAQTFDVVASNLTGDITLTASTGISLSGTNVTNNGNGTYTIALANANTTTTVTATWDGTTTTATGSIGVASAGVTTCTVNVTASADNTCFSKLYPNAANLVSEPFMNSMTAYASSWGNAGVTTANAYCGLYCGMVSGTRAGSITYPLSSVWKTNTKYRIKAKVLVSAGTFNLNVSGWSGSASDIANAITNTGITYNDNSTATLTDGAWGDIDFSFTTGSTLGTNQYFYFNNYASNSAGTGYIDNVEMYAVPKIYPSSSAITFLGLGSKKVAIRAENLSNDISITAPAGYTVSATTMASTVSGSTSDSLTINFTGPNSASGYIYFSSGSVKDSLQVTGTVAPTVSAGVSSLILDDLNPTETITVDGGNLTEDITLTAPAGITLSPSTISKSAASNVSVLVTYDATTSNVSGNIVLKSGSISKNISVVATKNADCFTPLYSTLTNLIPSPTLNTLTGFGGWGYKSVVAGEAYCGKNCVKFNALTNGWPDGAALDVSNIAWEANATYRFRALVKTVDGSCAFLANGTNPNYLKVVPQSGTDWVVIDETFTTGAAPTSGFFTFNNVDGSATGKVAYIDNYELYNITSLLTDLGEQAQTKMVASVQDQKIVLHIPSDIATTAELSVYALNGMRVVSQVIKLTNGMTQKTINTDLAHGVYIVKVSTAGKSYVCKVLK